MLLNPGADEIAGDVVTAGEPVQGLAAQVFLRHLTLELDAVGPVSRHGLPSFETPAPRSNHSSSPVCLQGPTPIRGRFQADLHFARNYLAALALVAVATEWVK